MLNTMLRGFLATLSKAVYILPSLLMLYSSSQQKHFAEVYMSLSYASKCNIIFFHNTIQTTYYNILSHY